MEVKKKTRAKRVPVTDSAVPAVVSLQELKPLGNSFDLLINKINSGKNELERLEKEISEVRLLWQKEQKDRQLQIQERNKQEEVARKREQETYDYELNLARKKDNDEFAEKKLRWEKELAEKKEELVKDKKELEELRKLVGNFPTEKEKAVKEACGLLEKELKEDFKNTQILTEQETRSAQSLLELKLANLTTDNTRQAKEIETLKKSLDEATRQVKEIAVKVIESGSVKLSPSPNES